VFFVGFVRNHCNISALHLPSSVLLDVGGGNRNLSYGGVRIYDKITTEASPYISMG
jgi:hypothetical protein